MPASARWWRCSTAPVNSASPASPPAQRGGLQAPPLIPAGVVTGDHRERECCETYRTLPLVPLIIMRVHHFHFATSAPLTSTAPTKLGDSVHGTHHVRAGAAAQRGMHWRRCSVPCSPPLLALGASLMAGTVAGGLLARRAADTKPGVPAASLPLEVTGCHRICASSPVTVSLIRGP